MTRLPKERGITQDGEDISLILRQSVGNSPKDKSNEESCAELDNSRTIPDSPISTRYLTKITAKRATRLHRKQTRLPVNTP